MNKTYTTRRFAVYEDTFAKYRECVRLIRQRAGVRPHEFSHDAILGAALALLIAKLTETDGQK